MFNRYIAILLVFSLVATNLSYYFVFAGFELKHKYIAEKLCENRDKPWLHCNGKCYFMKKIKQAREKQNSEESRSQKNMFQDAFYAQHAVVKFHTQLLRVLPIPNGRFNLPNGHISIFQPPQLG